MTPATRQASDPWTRFSNARGSVQVNDGTATRGMVRGDTSSRYDNAGQARARVDTSTQSVPSYARQRTAGRRRHADVRRQSTYGAGNARTYGGSTYGGASTRTYGGNARTYDTTSRYNAGTRGGGASQRSVNQAQAPRARATSRPSGDTRHHG